MSDLEISLLAHLRRIATHPAALGLADDAAILDWPLGQQLVATHDMLAEGVHFTSHCPAAGVGWKLLAVNLSDLAAMGARPVAVLMGAGIGSDRESAWAGELVRGLAQSLDHFGVPLIGGDTIRTGPATVLALTALGQLAPGTALTRSGARPGDDLWVSGTIGDAGLGLEVALDQRPHDAVLLKRYRCPTPRLALGHALLGVATAATDVSDGLLIDAGRLAAASGMVATMQLQAIPLSPAARVSGVAPQALAAMGDDYELLFAAPADRRGAVEDAARSARTPIARIGKLAPAGAGSEPAQLIGPDGAPVLLQSIGYRHS